MEDKLINDEIFRLQTASYNLALTFFSSGILDDLTSNEFKVLLLQCGFTDKDKIVNHKLFPKQ